MARARMGTRNTIKTMSITIVLRWGRRLTIMAAPLYRLSGLNVAFYAPRCRRNGHQELTGDARKIVEGQDLPFGRSANGAANAGHVDESGEARAVLRRYLDGAPAQIVA